MGGAVGQKLEYFGGWDNRTTRGHSWRWDIGTNKKTLLRERQRDREEDNVLGETE